MSTRCRFVTALLVACLSTFLCNIAQGQALSPQHYSYKVGSWDLNKLTGSNAEVIGFWGIPRTEVSVGNIRRLWFEALADGNWAVYAFEPTGAEGFITDLFAQGTLTQGSMEFFRKRERLAAMNLPDQDVDGGVQGEVEKGFIAGDPLTETVAAMADPTPMIDLLADVSYPIAPGMSNLLVSGTAGVNVNMNQVTKQLLDCLRSVGNSSCSECVCTETDGGSDYGPWTVYTIPPAGTDNRLRCDYTRVVTHYYWQVGKYPDDCVDCTIGSPENPASWTEIEETTDYWYEEEECPDTPL